MGKMRLVCVATFSLLLFINSRCKKGDAEPQLPPDTTTGAGTFGCKVDGRVFVPRSGRGRPGLYVEYNNQGTGVDGGWYLSISASDNIPANSEYIVIQTDSLFLEEGSNYFFKSGKGFTKVLYSYGLERYGVLPPDSGELRITKHDPTRHILSGQFWFEGTSGSGQKVKVTEGRFDVVY